MTIGEARSFVGSDVSLCWLDRKGQELREVARIFAADFVPLYGPCLITDAGDIRIDRVVSIDLLADTKIA
ncbi:MAG TPA: hypothetical protein VMI31_09615 [Fimbriimonadaceae bacterium]|nr:hypothetical protein [Fimbriimonadaceae bacterium]